MAMWDYDGHIETTTGRYYAEIFTCETGKVCWHSLLMDAEADCEEEALTHLQQLEEEETSSNVEG